MLSTPVPMFPNKMMSQKKSLTSLKRLYFSLQRNKLDEHNQRRRQNSNEDEKDGINYFKINFILNQLFVRFISA